MSKPTFEQLSELHEQVKAGRITRENLQDFLLDPNRGRFPSLATAADIIPKGWKIVEDGPSSLVEGMTIEVVSFLRSEDGGCVGSDTMRKRAVELDANATLADAKYLLDHQDLIPKEFRGKYLVFTGTVLRSPDDCLRVACLFWGGGEWYLYFDWLGRVWRDDDRLFRCK